MNNRQKKKLYKQTLIKVRKLHPSKDDLICLQFDPDNIDLETMCQFLHVYENDKAFGEAKIGVVPANIKKVSKYEAQIYINKLQSIVDEMGE